MGTAAIYTPKCSSMYEVYTVAYTEIMGLKPVMITNLLNF